MTVGDRVTLIGAYAFYNQKNLITLTMGPNSQVTDIGKYAFAVSSGNSKLTNLTLSPNLKNIHMRAFQRTGLAEITIPKSVVLVDEYAFYYATAKEIIFEGGGTEGLTVKRYAFAYMSKLETITFPARLETLYETTTLSSYNGSFKNFNGRFNNDTLLKTINVEPGGENFCSVDGVLYEMDVEGNPTILLLCPQGRTGEYVIPKEVRLVENGAFVNSKLTKVSFEEYDKADPSYGQPLLEVGVGTAKNTSSNSTYAVFSGSIQEINFPSHLKRLGVQTGYNLKAVGTKINFNMDAVLQDIGGLNFVSCIGVTELHLPEIHGMGIGCFRSMSAVTNITMGPNSTITEIPEGTFWNCKALTAIHLPASVTKIGIQAFDMCSVLTTVTFEEGSQLQSIGKYAFRKTNLAEVVMPDGVTNLDIGVFNTCTNLKTVTLGKGLTAINLSEGPFAGCSALENVFVAKDNPSYVSVDGVLYDLAQTIIYCYPAAKDPAAHTLPSTLITIADYAFHSFRGMTIVLPESVETISDHAFEDTMLQSIHIPKNVTSIGYRAFYNTNLGDGSLSSVTFAEDSKLETIGGYAFFWNEGLTEMILPDNVNSIGTYAFTGCTNLEKVVLPANLKNLQQSTFSNCPSIKSFTMQEGLEAIGQYALDNTSRNNNAITELVIPSTVTSISSYAFRALKALKSLTFAEGSLLESVGTEVFGDCISLESVALPAKLNYIGGASATWTEAGLKHKFTSSRLFRGCTSLKVVDMSACVELTTMPGEMFSDCISIETMLLPPNLETISSLAFTGRTGYASTISLKEITIPASVTSIGGYAFKGCTSLETVIFEQGNTITQLGLREAVAGDHVTGVGIFADTTSLKKVVLPENLTMIGVGCFENSGVAEMDIPSSVTTIAERAFRNCVNIQKAALSPMLTYLGDEAFYGCEKLEEAPLYFGLEYLGAQAFAYSGLKHAYIPATVTSISGNPFAGCTAIESFTLDPDSADFKVVDGVLYDSAMFALIYYPANLTAETFEIPATVYELADGAFAGANLKSMVIPERFTELPASLFQRSALESITFHRGITAIGDYAFEGCKNLNNVTLLNNITNLGNYIFANCTALDSFVFEEIPANGAPYVFGTHFFDGCTAITELILPNSLKLSSAADHGISSTNTTLTTAIPAYMFANTGLVNVVLPARIVNVASDGVFYGCKQMETFTFEATKLNPGMNGIGDYYFYGCSKLKELVIPTGMYTSFAGKYVFAYCTSLERIVINGANNYALSATLFEGCTSLQVIDMGGTNFMQISANVFKGLTSLKYLNLGNKSPSVYSVGMFAGSHIETVRIAGFGNSSGALFSGTENLKNVWIGSKLPSNNANLFTSLETDMNFYFYTMTKEEVIAASGGKDDWFTNASDKAHFYFKDTIPADVEIPEDVQNDMK